MEENIRTEGELHLGEITIKTSLLNKETKLHRSGLWLLHPTCVNVEGLLTA